MTPRPFRPSVAQFAVQCLVAALAIGHTGLAGSAPAQQPLFKKAGGSVAPNLFYTLDDSGSMGWTYAPSSTSVWAGENNSRYPVMHPKDMSSSTGLPPSSGSACLVKTPTPTSTPSAQDRAAMRLRSPDVNKIYYNPGIRYQPWARPNVADSPFGDSVFTAAPVDPRRIYNSADGVAGSVNLNTAITTSSSYTWCTSNSSESNKSYDMYPASYYRLSSGSVASNNDLYTRVRLDSGGSPPADFAKSAKRTDCIAIANRCSLAEERVNFANWYTYYRTRSLLARGATSLAFSKIAQKVRVGYGQLNNGGSATEAGQSYPNVTRGVRDFGANTTTRTQFFNWLYKVPYQSGTPLRVAMDNVGKYFTATSTTGPWGADPSSATGVDTPTAYQSMASCRRSYHIMMTDGYWNGSAASTLEAAGNSDKTAGPLIADSSDDTERKYQYDPSFTNGINTTKSPYKDDYSGTLADVAHYYWSRDLHPGLKNNVRTAIVAENKLNPDKPYYNKAEKIDRLDHAFWQHLTTYTVGLGVAGSITDTTTVPPTVAWPQPVPDGATAVDDLFHAAVNGRGKYLKASDPQEYQDAIEQTLNEIFATVDAKSGVALSGFQVDGNTKRYVPSFNSPEWTGNVTASLLSTGEVMWFAESALPAHTDRKIFVWNGSNAESFVSGMSSSVTTAMGDSSADLINFLRGDRSKEGGLTGFRCRGDQPGTTNCAKGKDSQGNPNKIGLFGDVVNSMPLLLSNNLDMNYQLLTTSEGGTYRAFIKEKQKRVASTGGTQALLVGANDGMLHVLNDSNGAEIAAFIPQVVLPNLKRLSNRDYGNTTVDSDATSHRFFVDGKLLESDAYINGAWTNVVLGATGAGGKSVFALKFDAANPRSVTGSNMMWEINATSSSALSNKDRLGHVTGTMAVGKMKNGDWAAIFGNGMDSTDGGAYLWIVNIRTGQPIVAPIQAGTDKSSNGLGGVTLIRDGNRNVIGAYAGDAKGKLWRFDLESTTASAWKTGLSGQPLLDVGSTKPITAAPTFLLHPKGGLMVLFGTGRLYTTADESTTDTQSLYGVWDLTIPGQSSTSQPVATSTQIIQHQVSSTPVSGTKYKSAYTMIPSATKMAYTNGNGIRGWRVDQTVASGERDIYDPFTLSDIAFFNTTAPSVDQAGDPCMAVSSKSYLYALNPLTGEMLPYSLYDTNGDGVINKKDPPVVVVDPPNDGGPFEPFNPPPEEPPGGCGAGKRAYGIASNKSSEGLCASSGYIVRTWQQIQNHPKPIKE